ncbi:T9SS type A sorting domain-containing protein [Winogradskyella litorisediminis]|uniref:T9SS type A sorting domain-containing protein n=1 Tax=Winogradskyella litorisediminis TaxID=1156618 RepID=A0ABW3N5D7_9FLAO
MKVIKLLICFCLGFCSIMAYSQKFYTGLQGAVIEDNNSLFYEGWLNSQVPTNYTVPFQTPANASGIKKVALGADFHNILYNDGTLISIGKNDKGQLGLGYTTNSGVAMTSYSAPLSPVNSGVLNNVIDISSDYYGSLALTSNGHVLMWGEKNGMPLTLLSPTFVKIDNTTKLSGIQKIYNPFGSYTFYAIDNNQDVWVWGNNSNGQFGNGTTTGVSYVARKIPNLSGVVDIAGTQVSTHFLLSNGIVKSLGSNFNGLLGNNSTVNSSTSPVNVLLKDGNKTVTLSDVIEIEATNYSVQALLQNGKVVSWGSNAFGDLGIGNMSQANSSVGLEVRNPNNTGLLTGISELYSSGFGMIYAKRGDCDYLVWGRSFEPANSVFDDLPRTKDYSMLPSCNVSYSASSTRICPNTCIDIEASLGSGLSGATISWSFPGADTTTGSAVTENVCYSNPGTYDILASINGAPLNNTGISIEVLPPNNRVCQTNGNTGGGIGSANRTIIYPNPTKTNFKIKTERNKNIKNVKIKDLHGKVLREFDGQTKDYFTKGLISGVFMVEISYDNNEKEQLRLLIK